MLELAEDDEEFFGDLSELLERGHLVAMNDNLPVAEFDKFVSSLVKFKIHSALIITRNNCQDKSNKNLEL